MKIDKGEWDTMSRRRYLLIIAAIIGSIYLLNRFAVPWASAYLDLTVIVIILAVMLLGVSAFYLFLGTKGILMNREPDLVGKRNDKTDEVGGKPGSRKMIYKGMSAFIYSAIYIITGLVFLFIIGVIILSIIQ